MQYQHDAAIVIEPEPYARTPLRRPAVRSAYPQTFRGEHRIPNHNPGYPLITTSFATPT